MTNLKALFWAASAAVALIAVVVTIGAYSGEFGFSGNEQTQSADAAQPVGAGESDTIVPAAADDVEYVENEGDDRGDGDDAYEHEREGDREDDGEWDD